LRTIKDQELAASAAPTGLLREDEASALAVAFDLDPRGPSASAEPADKTRRAPHMDVRRFFAPGFFAQAKKGGSRRHGAKRF
jgi:hypothetical protein